MEAVNNIKYSVIKALSRPFWRISDRLAFFGALTLIFALILCGFSFLFEAVFNCSFTPNDTKEACTNFTYIYLLFLFFKIIFLAVFIRIWLDGVKQIKDIKFVNGVFKTLIMIFGFALINALPAVSAIILFYREPNPIWQIELAFFTIISLGFVAPFALMRFYGLIGAWLENKKNASVRHTWQNSKGLSFKILLSTALLYMFIMTLFISCNAPSIRQNVFLGEFIENVVLLLSVTIIVNFMIIQRELLLPDEDK